MIMLECIAVISTLVCVMLTARENVLGWPLAVISAIFLIILYIHKEYYGQVILQLIFLCQALYGWYNWGKIDSPPISSVPNKIFLLHIISVVTFAVFISIIIQSMNTNVGNKIYLDCIITSIGILGEIYLIKKQIQSWLLFMTYNILLTIMTFYDQLYPITVLNMVLFTISLTGYLKWKKKKNY